MIRKLSHIMLFAALILNLTGSAALARADGGCLMPCCSPADCGAPQAVEDPPCCDPDGAECGTGSGEMNRTPEAAVARPGGQPCPREAAVLPAPAAPDIPVCRTILAPACGRMPVQSGKIPLYLSNAVRLC